MTRETTRIKTLAEQAYNAFREDKRTDGTEYWHTGDNAPGWLQDMCHQAHGDMFPDDHRYEIIVECLSAICDCDDPEDIALEPDVYHSHLTSWLASHLSRIAYCDEALEEYGSDAGGVMQIIAMGQLREKEEVLGQIMDFFRENGEDILCPEDGD
jgi:hypothetical protein